MALVQCSSCNHQIDSAAKACPSCGAPNSFFKQKIQFGGLIYFAIIGAIFYWLWGLMSGEPKATTDIPYTVTKDEHRPAAPRKVEVLLPRRLSAEELAQVSAAVRDSVSEPADRTLIGYRVEGQQDTAYWANASFDPDYSSHVIGLTAEGYQKLSQLDLSHHKDILGHWFIDGALGHVMVLHREGGKYLIDQYFEDGSHGSDVYSARKLGNGELRLEQPNDHGEYYVLKADGSLEGWSENGKYLTLPKRS